MKIICAALVALAAYALYGVGGVNGLSSDDFMRLYLACKWADSPVLLQVAEWPPMYNLIHGAVQGFGFNPLHTGHAVTAILFGLIAYVSLAIIELFLKPSYQAAAMFLLLGALSPLVFYMSASLLSEPLFLLIGLMQLYAFLCWQRSKDPATFYISAGLMAALTATRIDAWPLAAVYASYILYVERDKRSVVTTFIMAAFPLYWMLIIAQRFGSPWALFTAYREDVASYYKDVSKENIRMLGYFLKSFPLFPIALVLGVKSFKKDKTLAPLLGVLVITLVVQLLIVWNRAPTVYVQRVFLFSGFISTLCLVVALGPLTRLKVILPLAVQLVAFVLFQSEFKPAYRFDMEAAAHRLKLDYPKVFAETSMVRIGSDLDPSELPILALTTGYPEKFKSIALSPQGQLLLPYPDTPTVFLVKSEKIMEIFLRKNPKHIKKIQDSLFWIE